MWQNYVWLAIGVAGYMCIIDYSTEDRYSLEPVQSLLKDWKKMPPSLLIKKIND